MFQTISMRHLEDLLECRAEITLLDVREREEFARGCLRGAVNIPIGELPDRLQEIPRDRPVIIYCAYGSHSLMAARLLDGHGYYAASATGGLAYYRGRNFVAGTSARTGREII